jgi:membrane-anchored protein YejM (alkaline phosphatase superfamily)
VPTLISTLELGDIGRNEALTRKFEGWLAARTPDRPFFALLWYGPTVADAAPHVGLARDGRYASNPRADELWNGYRQGMHRIDGEVTRVLAALDQAGRASDTLVIVASDHGYEFDDLGLGHYGHASNYGAPQLRSLLLMRWPGREPRAFGHRSSHPDLPPTLLQELFGCRNPPSDYGMGRNLFDGVSWDWIIAGSYHSFAIVQPDRILVSYPGGLTEVLGPDLQPPAGATLDAELIERALAEMRRFYR